MSGTSGAAPGLAGRQGVARLLQVVMVAREPARLAAFYRDALAFTVEAGARTTLRLGEQVLGLDASAGGAPYPADSRSWDHWFQHVAIIVGDMAAAYARLRAVGCTAISRDGPERLPESSGGVTAFKFRDPEGHPLELLQFPRGREPAPWRGRAEVLLGVDHSAIAVSDVRRSVEFYTALGLARVSAGMNQGVEQERMDDAPGAVVDVVGLAPGVVATPHVELLGYRVPEDGRPMPAGAGMGDVLATRLVLGVTRLAELAGAIERGGGRVMSEQPGRVVARDPDGHLLELSAGLPENPPLAAS